MNSNPVKHPFTATGACKPKMKTRKPHSFLQIIRYLVLLGFAVFFVFFSLSDFPLLLTTLLLITVFGGSFFCGWICPMALVQDLLGRLAFRLGIKQKNFLPRKVHLALIPLRYILFACVFYGVGSMLYYLAFADGRRSIHTLIGADIPHIFAGVILLLFLGLSLFYKRVFCSYFCVEGAKQALIGPARIFTIVRNPDTCINCKKCDSACPMSINVSLSGNVQSPQCVNCFQCICACPVQKTLGYGLIRPHHDPAGFQAAKKGPLPPVWRWGVLSLRFALACVFFVFWAFGEGQATAEPRIEKAALPNSQISAETGPSVNAETGASSGASSGQDSTSSASQTE